MHYETQYAAYQQAIEEYLSGLFTADTPYKKLYESIRYSLLAGGKRIRPVLTLEFARLGGIDWHLALPYGCALELVHNYSLIHDDLPCMDDDDMRRGKPSANARWQSHKAVILGDYILAKNMNIGLQSGQFDLVTHVCGSMAVLAGDAMQPEAFRLLAEAPCLSAENRLEAVRTLSRACGADGMVAGQVLDTVYDVGDEAGLTTLNRLKTGVMISAAAELGCIAAEMPAAPMPTTSTSTSMVSSASVLGSGVRKAVMAAALDPPATSACSRQSRAAVSTALLVAVAPVIASTPTDWFSRMRGSR